jgi:hypothetical protein
MGREKSITSAVEMSPVMRESFRENCISSLKRLFHTSWASGTRKRDTIANTRRSVIKREIDMNVSLNILTLYTKHAFH